MRRCWRRTPRQVARRICLAATLFLDRVVRLNAFKRMLWNRLHCHSLPSRALSGRALAGVVGSGDMEVLYHCRTERYANVEITTSVDNSPSALERADSNG